MRRIVLALAAVFSFLLAPWVMEARDVPAPLSLEECLAVAEANHPALEEARATIDGEKARLGQIRTSNAVKGDASLSVSASSGGNESYSTSFTVSKLVYDSGRNTLQRKRQTLSLDSASESARGVVLSVRTAVKTAYYDLLLAERRLDQAEEAVGSYERHLNQAKAFYEVGTKPKFDVTKAEVDLGNAKMTLVSAEAAVRSGWAALANAMGVLQAETTLSSPFRPVQLLPSEEAALAGALENRPEVRGARLKSEMDRIGIAIAAKGNAATASVSGSAVLSGSDFPLDDDYRAGVSLSIPVFDGGTTRYQVDEARATSRGTEAAEKRITQSAVYDVRTRLLAVREAESRIPVAELLVRQATENLELAEGRYNAGVGNALEVTDAILASNEAKLSHVQALHDYSTALSALEQALGAELE